MSYWVIGITCFAAGGAFIWFCKDTLQKWVIGANALAVKLHAKADAIKKAAGS